MIFQDKYISTEFYRKYMSTEMQILTCDKIKYEFDQALDNSLRVSFSNLKKGSTQHSVVSFAG